MRHQYDKTGEQENRRNVSCMLPLLFIVHCGTNYVLLTGQQDVNDILFNNDDDNDGLPKGRGLRKTAAGTGQVEEEKEQW